MFNKEEFKEDAQKIIDWIAEYYSHVENFPVRSQLHYGEIKKTISKEAPEISESFDAIFQDFQDKIIPGITHWQSPKYFAYFPANNSIPSVFAEFLTAALGVQGMKWITSPAATELEEVVTDWLRKMIGLPDLFKGVIQDSASVATLCAILAAREKVTGFQSNTKGLLTEKIRVYCSDEAHSSVEKAVRIAGIGSENLVKIQVDKECRMLAEDLEKAIAEDISKGYKPACVVGALGTTGTCAIDPIGEIAEIAGKFNVWFHVDAAFAGTALILPEFRKTIDGLQKADSIVFNPHKWMFTNFDCSVFFVRDEKHFQNTFRLVPHYLQTDTDHEVNDYSNWGIQLGRRFRALKLWFVIRNFGVKGLQDKLRKHIQLAEYFESAIRNSEWFELAVPRSLAVVSFGFKSEYASNDEKVNKLNAELLKSINKSGKAYMSHTIVHGKYTLRFVCAQTNTEKKHVDEAVQLIFSLAEKMIKLD